MIISIMKKTAATTVVGVCYAAYVIWARHESVVVVQPTQVTKLTSVTNSLPLPTTNNTPSQPAPVAPIITPAPVPAPPKQNTALYKDGTYTGDAADAYYGLIKVAAVIQNGALSQVKFLQYPNTHRKSVAINQQAMPYLQQEAIQAQKAQVDIVSGATYTSTAFQQSLASALAQAANAPN